LQLSCLTTTPDRCTEQEYCHHCFCNLSFDEKQKVSLPLLPAPRHRRPLSPVSKEAALPPVGPKHPQANSRCLLTAGASASHAPETRAPPRAEPVRGSSPGHAPVWVCPSARHHGCSWSSAWKGFGYLPFLPPLISDPERSRHPASSCSVSGFLGNLPCCDSSNITATARTKPLKEEIPSPF